LVVEEAFAPLVRLHPAVDEVIPVAVRRWRQTPLQPSTWRQVAAFRRTLRGRSFDEIVDTQGLLKSALIARCAQGAGTATTATASRSRRRPGFTISSIRSDGASTRLRATAR